MTAEQIERLERPELAAEFLSRNRTYQLDRQRMLQRVQKGEISADDADAWLAQRWGLSFRRRAG
jgi:hypothetical protein